MREAPLFTGDPEADMEVAKRLIASHPDVNLPALVAIAADRTQPVSARIAAVYALGFTDDRGISAGTLRRIVQGDEPDAVRDHAAEALASICPGA